MFLVSVILSIFFVIPAFDKIAWIVSDNSSTSQNSSIVTIDNFRFQTDVIHFSIYGSITFKGCEFLFNSTQYVYISILRNPNEIEPTMSSSDEVLTKVYGQVDRHQVKFVQCVFMQREDFYDYRGIKFFIEGIFSKTSFEQCEVVSHVHGGWRHFSCLCMLGMKLPNIPMLYPQWIFIFTILLFITLILSVNAKTRRSFVFIWIYQSLFNDSRLDTV